MLVGNVLFRENRTFAAILGMSYTQCKRLLPAQYLVGNHRPKDDIPGYFSIYNVTASLHADVLNTQLYGFHTRQLSNKLCLMASKYNNYLA